MKRLSPKAHPLQLLSIFFFTSSLLLIGSNSPQSAADYVTQEGWRIEIEEGKSTRSTLTINNRCSAAHLFRIKTSAKFLRFEQPTDSVQIQAKSNKQIGLRFDATALEIKVYRSTVMIECLDCKKEPGCNQDRDELPVEMIVVKAKKIVAPGPSGSIIGRVVDPRNNPITGVEVRTPGQPVVLTNGKGEFDIRGLVATERLAVSFSARGFIETTRIYEVGVSSRITGNVVVIWPRATPAALDVTRGGKLTFPGGTVSLPPNALVDELGRQLRGNVRVSFSALDVSDRRQIRSVPGDFTARMRNNTIRQLETFGVFEVFVEDSNGRRANLAPGKTARVELSIPPALRRTAPKVVGLFSFDKDSGRWVEEATLQSTPRQASYTASISTINTIWNADMTSETTCLKLKILEGDCTLATGVAGAHVEAFGVDYSGFSEGYADSNGEVCLLVKRNATVSLIAHHPNLSTIQSNPLEITTASHVGSTSDCANCALCPLVTTHFANAAFLDGLNTDDPQLWSKAHEWANGDPNFDVGWNKNQVKFSSGLMTLMLSDYADTPSTPTACSPPNANVACSNKPFASGEYRTKCFYGYGTYKATFKTANPKGSGLITTFFTYTGPSEGTWHDEIDIEILGKDPVSPCITGQTMMQTNYFVKGVGGHEHIVCLNFDASLAEHTYEFVWSPTDIKWYVDRPTNPLPVHTETRTPLDAPWPSQPGRIMVNMWAGSSSATGWLGPFAYPGTPIYAEYNSIQYSP